MSDPSCPRATTGSGRGGPALVLGLLVACASPAAAQATLAPAAETPAAPVPDADPDAARGVVQWRGALRATLGLTLPVLRAARVTVDVLPRIELHEPPGSGVYVPNQFWRGLFDLRFRYTAVLNAQQVEIEARAFHESDHETVHAYAGEPGFLSLNGLALGLVVSRDVHPVRLQAAAHGRLYVFSCTLRRIPCADFESSTTLGGALSLAARGPDLGWAGLMPFAAVFGSGILQRGVVRGERRLVLRAGVQHPMPAGDLHWFAGVFLGHDVGITRNRIVEQWTLGLAWQPAR